MPIKLGNKHNINLGQTEVLPSELKYLPQKLLLSCGKINLRIGM